MNILLAAGLFLAVGVLVLAWILPVIKRKIYEREREAYIRSHSRDCVCVYCAEKR